MIPGRRRALATAVAVAALFALSIGSPGCTGGRHRLRAKKTTERPAVSLAAARYRGKLIIGDRKVSFRANLYASRPDSLRAEFFSPLGHALVILAARDGQARAMIPRERLSWEGGADDRTLRRIGLLRGASFWAALLTDDARALEGMVGTSYRSPPNGGERSVLVEERDGDLLKVELADERGVPPRWVRADLTRGGRSISIEMERRTFLDPEAGEGAYRLEVPESFRRLDDLDLIAMIAGSDSDPQ